MLVLSIFDIFIDILFAFSNFISLLLVHYFISRGGQVITGIEIEIVIELVF